MSERILFITGKLAEKSLRRTLTDLSSLTFDYDIRVLGAAVAALMTTDFIHRRLDDVEGFDRILIPGRCRGDMEALTAGFGVPFARGPEELKDLPRFFGIDGQPHDLTRTDMLIFAELVEAPLCSVATILERAGRYRDDGADVIDIGCLPDTAFPHLEDTVAALKAADFKVSVDSLVDEELLRGGRAGADYLFSLSAETLWIADEVDSVPILIGDSEISTTKKLQSADIGKFLHNTGTKVWAQGARAYLAVGPAVSAMTEMAGGGTPMPSVFKGMNSGLDGLTFKTLKSEADRAQIELTLNGRTELMAFTKVEERWVPTDVVDQWAKMKPSIESFLDSLESPETHKLMDDMEKILDQMIADLDKLEAIQSRGKFFTALEKMGKKYVDQFKDVVTLPR